MTEEKTWDNDEKHAFEVWKYYGGIGGADKDRMIQIVSWLLGFSAAIVGAYASGKLLEPLAKVLLIVVGILISLLAMFVALMYGGYALWNWSIADQIARTYKWTEQKPDYDPFEGTNISWTATFPLILARPCTNTIAPVFWAFFGISLGSLIIHVVLLICTFLSE
jgi:hypothetical protein